MSRSKASPAAASSAVRMTAKMEVKAVKIDPSLMKADEREILEDLLVTAHNDARRKAEAAMQEKMQALTGGLGLPPGIGPRLPTWPLPLPVRKSNA